MKLRIDHNKIFKVGFAHLFLLVHFLISPELSANSRNNGDVHAAYMDILKLKLKSGRSALDKIAKDQSDGHFFYARNIADVLELLITEDRSLYKKYEDHEDDNLRGVKIMSDDDPYKLFYTAEIKLQWAMVKLLFGDEIKAGWALRSSLNTIIKNRKQFPNFRENYKTLGLLHILFATVPENYQWVMNLMGMKGDLGKGWDELNMITDDSPFWLEVEIIKSLVSLNILSDGDEALARLKGLLGTNKDNLLTNYLYNFVLVKLSRSEEAISNFKRLLYLSSDYLYIHHIYYQLGEINMQKGDYNLARFYYSKFLNHYPGQNYLKDTWYKVFLSYWLEGDLSMADVHHKKALNSGRVFVDADKNANGILNADKYPDVEIMKIRLATDGGYFHLAEQLANRLIEEDFEEKKDRAELNYRIARLNHKQKKLDDAIFYYLNAIKKSGKSNWYFAPNSCLNLGYIYRQKSDLVKARHYFKKVLTYKKHKYKSEIDTKAIAAIHLLDLNLPTVPVRM